MRAIDITLGVGWGVFWLGWLVSAVGAKSGRVNVGRNIGGRLVVIALVIGLERVPALRGSATHNLALGVIGLGLFAAGIAVAVWARVHLGRNWGMPMSEKADADLVTTGPYRWIRNPIYSGLILALTGTAIAVRPGWLVIVVAVGGFFVYSAVVEQRIMSEKFPDTYPAYRDSTKMLIPYVF